MTTNIYNMADTWNAIGTTFDAIKMNVTDGAAGFPVGAAASQLINIQTNATQRFGVRSPHFALGADITPFLNLVDIWNTSGAAVGIKYNVTDTASAAASLLMDLQLGGASKFNVGKGGTGGFVLDGGFQTVGSYSGNNIDLRFLQATGPVIKIAMGLGVGGLQFSSGYTLQWTSAAAASTADLILVRDAANTLAQRNSTTAQEFRIYNTFTDASNYERLHLDFTSNANRATIAVDALGTGTQRPLDIWASSFVFKVGAGGSTTVVDFSSTRTNFYGNLQFQNDNTNDIGASGATRPRNVYIAAYLKYNAVTLASLSASFFSAASAGNGATAYITDAVAQVFGATVAGGGAINTPVYSDGTQWKSG